MNTETKKRDITFDIYKGIGIILMVIGHTESPINSFIFLFHMAIFFICSGIFFKEKNYETIDSVIKSVKSKIKHLYVPFVLWNVFLTLIHNFLIKINIYTNNPNFLISSQGFENWFAEYSPISKIASRLINTLLFCHTEMLGAATWFLRSLFWISIVVLFGHYLSKIFIKNKRFFIIIQVCCFILALFTGFLLQKLRINFYSIGTMFTCSFLYYLGIQYQSYKEKIKINLYSFALSLIILLVANNYYKIHIDLSRNIYPNPLWLLLVSVAGFIFILYISKLLLKNSTVTSFLSFVGQHTISILLFHFAAFKLLTLLLIWLYSKPQYFLAVPTLRVEGYWWLLYSIVGVLVPLMFAYIWQNVLIFIKSLYRINKT